MIRLQQALISNLAHPDPDLVKIDAPLNRRFLTVSLTKPPTPQPPLNGNIFWEQAFVFLATMKC